MPCQLPPDELYRLLTAKQIRNGCHTGFVDPHVEAVTHVSSNALYVRHMNNKVEILTN